MGGGVDINTDTYGRHNSDKVALGVVWHGC
jgi:hypothetical protein